MKVLKSVLVGLALCFLSLQIFAKPKVETKIKNYEISGTTFEEIHNCLQQKRPVVAGQKDFDAYTLWRFSWFLKTHESKGLCEVLDVNVALEVEIIFPKLNNVDALPKSLKQKWQSYEKNLWKHEEKHEEIAISAANAIEKNLKKLKPAENCETLLENAKKTVVETQKDYDEKQKEYDIKTDHGRKKKAVFF